MDDEDSSTSSWEDTSGSTEGKHNLQKVIGDEGASLLIKSRVRFGDESLLSIMNSEEMDDTFPYTRELHDESNVFHYIPNPNYLERSETPSRFHVEVLEMGSDQPSKQLTGTTLRLNDDHISQEDNSQGLNRVGSRHGFWNIPMIPIRSDGNSNYPSNSVGKRNGSVKRLKKNINNLYGIQGTIHHSCIGHVLILQF